METPRNLKSTRYFFRLRPDIYVAMYIYVFSFDYTDYTACNLVVPVPCLDYGGGRRYSHFCSELKQHHKALFNSLLKLFKYSICRLRFDRVECSSSCSLSVA